MWIYLIALLISLWLAKFYYYSVHLTIKQMKKYKQQFQKAGYKVKYQGFRLFLPPLIKQLKKGETKHNNPFYYYQQELPSYDVVVTSMLNKPMVVLLHPDLLQEYYTKNTDCYQKLDLIVDQVARAIGKGLFFSEDEEWKKKRKILSGAFHYSFIKQLTPKILQTTDDIFDTFQKKSVHLPMRMVLLQEFQKIYSSVMLKFFFGYQGKQLKIDGQEPSYFMNNLMAEMRTQTISIFFLLFGAKFFDLGLRKIDRDMNRKIRAFKQFALDIVSSRVKQLKQKNFKREDKPSGDLIEQLYLSGVLDTTGGQNAFNYEELIEQFCGFFLAGTQTTALLVTMTIIYLNKHQKHRVQLEKQIKQFIKSDQDYNEENLQKMDFLTACLKETMRFYGPANSIMIRQVRKNYKFKDVDLTKDTLLNPFFVGNNFNSTYYKQPYQWNPERWLNQNKTQQHSYIYLPFSAGKRNCIGQNLAMTEGKVALARFMQRYNFEIKDQIKMRLVFMLAPLRFETLLTKK